MSILKVLQSVKKKSLKPRKNIPEKKYKEVKYNNEIQDVLSSFKNQITNLRNIGHGRELEYIIEEIFKTVRLNYVENSSNKDKGVDFALWSNELGKIVGNPIIVEVKYGNLSNSTIKNAEQQLLQYINKSDAKVAILLYLDKKGKRFKIQSSLSPLMMAYDVEDFITDLLNHSFEGLVLNQRNKIAHGNL